MKIYFTLFIVVLVACCFQTAQTFQEKVYFIEADIEYQYHISNDYFGEAFGFTLPSNASSVTITVTTDSSVDVTAFARIGAWPSFSFDHYVLNDFVPSVSSMFFLEYPTTAGIVVQVNATSSLYSDFIPGQYFYFAPVAFFGPATVNGNVSVHFEYCPPGQIAAEIPSGCADYTEVQPNYSETNVTIDSYKFYVIQVPESTANIGVAVSYSADANVTVLGRVGSAGTLDHHYVSPISGNPGVQSLTTSFVNPPAGIFVITVRCDSNCSDIAFDISINMTVCPANWAGNSGSCDMQLNLMQYSSPFSMPVTLPANTGVYFGVHLGAMASDSCNATLTKVGTGSSTIFFREAAWPAMANYDASFSQTSMIRFFPEDFYVPNDRWYYIGIINTATTSDTWQIDVICQVEVVPSPSPSSTPVIPSASASPIPSASPLPVSWKSYSRLHWMEADTNYSFTFSPDHMFGDMFAFFVPENAAGINITAYGSAQVTFLSKLESWPINDVDKLVEAFYVLSVSDIAPLLSPNNFIDWAYLSADPQIPLALWAYGPPSDFVPGSYIYLSSLSYAPESNAWIEIQVDYCPEGQIAANPEPSVQCVEVLPVPANYSANVHMPGNPFYKYYKINIPENTAQLNVIVSNTSGNFTISGRVGSAATPSSYYDTFSAGAPGDDVHATFSNLPAGNFIVTVYCDSQCQDSTFDIAITTITCPDDFASDGTGSCIFPLMKAHYSMTIGTNTIEIPPATDLGDWSWVYLGVHFGPLAINYCNATLAPYGISSAAYLRRMAWPTSNYYDAMFFNYVTLQMTPEDIYVPNDMWYYLGFVNPSNETALWDLTVSCEVVAGPSPTPSATPVASPSRTPTPSLNPSPSKSPSADNSNNSNNKKLSTGGIIGIAVGIPLGALAIIGAFLVFRNQQKKEEHKQMQSEMKQMAPRDEEKAPSNQNTPKPQSSDSESSEEESSENDEN